MFSHLRHSLFHATHHIPTLPFMPPKVQLSQPTVPQVPPSEAGPRNLSELADGNSDSTLFPSVTTQKSVRHSTLFLPTRSPSVCKKKLFLRVSLLVRGRRVRPRKFSQMLETFLGTRIKTADRQTFSRSPTFKRGVQEKEGGPRKEGGVQEKK